MRYRDAMNHERLQVRVAKLERKLHRIEVKHTEDLANAYKYIKKALKQEISALKKVIDAEKGTPNHERQNTANPRAIRRAGQRHNAIHQPQS